MSDVESSETDRFLQRFQQGAHFFASLFIKRAQWLVETEQARLNSEGTRESNALALPTAEAKWSALQEIGNAHGIGEHFNFFCYTGALPFLHSRPECDLIPHRHRWEQGTILWHQSNSAFAGRQSVNGIVTDSDRPLTDRTQPTNGFQQCRLTAAGSSHENSILAIGHIQADSVETKPTLLNEQAINTQFSRHLRHSRHQFSLPFSMTLTP
ncbi:MAG: hypothetical protein ACI9R3_004321 [Verrucomicrobiales bacterium]|jgi:hypothetical protein